METANMNCPKCDSPNVTKLPPSQITPKPGYRCEDCGAKLRAPGTAIMYLFVMAIGVAMFVLIGGLFVSGEMNGRIPLKAFWIAGIGVICAVYSVSQLVRPVPRDDRGHPGSGPSTNGPSDGNRPL